MTLKEIKNMREKISTLVRMPREIKIIISQGMLIMMTMMTSSFSCSMARIKIIGVTIQTKTTIIKMVMMQQNMMYKELLMSKEMIICFNKDLKIIHIEYLICPLLNRQETDEINSHR